jgi:hypothetical protein
MARLSVVHPLMVLEVRLSSVLAAHPWMVLVVHLSSVQADHLWLVLEVRPSSALVVLNEKVRVVRIEIDQEVLYEFVR